MAQAPAHPKPLRYERLPLPGLGPAEQSAETAPAAAGSENCIFCRHADPRLNTVLMRRGTMYARWDNFPASQGHVEIVPFRHVNSFFDLVEKEVRDMHILAKAVRLKLDQDFEPDSYTIGINDGAAAGQSIPHVHLHIIPRWHGDVPDPRGGIRRLFPDCDPDDWLK